jgi:hypothetical protein
VDITRKTFLKKISVAGVSLAVPNAILGDVNLSTFSQEDSGKVEWPEDIQIILDNTKPLEYPRDQRLPLYLWPAVGSIEFNSKTTPNLLKELDARGIGLVYSWNKNDVNKSIKNAINVAKVQSYLGQPVNIDASYMLHSLFDGDESTAHIDESGNRFFDDSFGKDHKMGCPFTLNRRKREIRKRVEPFVKAYKDYGVKIDFVFTDWEIDGPTSANGSFFASHKCTRCRKYLGDGFTYSSFQKTMRDMRAYIQNYFFSNPVLTHFPHALVGNYSDYPCVGYRYWYDHYEYLADWQPYKNDQHAKYRKWYNNFSGTGFTMAMPVVYPWGNIYGWYDYEDTDYRWFYNMLLVGSNAGGHTAQSIPMISFVHWNPILAVKMIKDKNVTPMSKDAYKELLWHLLLRGIDTFFMWASRKQYPDEVRLVHEVYAAAQQYGNFLENGMPINFNVPDKPGPVISGLALGNKILVRRTNFGMSSKSVSIIVGTEEIQVESIPGTCQIIKL